MAMAEPPMASTFIRRAKSSTTKAPPKAVTLPEPVPQITTAIDTMRAITAPEATVPKASRRLNTPSSSSTMASTASRISGAAATASAC